MRVSGTNPNPSRGPKRSSRIAAPFHVRVGHEQLGRRQIIPSNVHASFAYSMGDVPSLRCLLHVSRTHNIWCWRIDVTANGVVT
jgi:hypothetical protein